MAVDIEARGAVRILTLNRREALNAFNTQQLETFLEAIDAVNMDEDARAVVLTGAGDRAFAAGADIKEMKDKSPLEAKAFGDLGHAIGRSIEASPVPWIAAVNGYAFGGGCEVTLACDIRIASENAVFAQPEVGLGIPPGWGGTQRLTRLVGQGLAAELIYTGRWMKADEALRVGLVTAVYPQDELMAKAVEMAEKIASNAPLAIEASKRAIKLAQDTNLDAGLEYESQMFALLFGTSDQREGMAAFAEKRTPEFTGN